MAKSNAQRQREWRERQKKKRQCAYGGCPNPVEPPATLCAEHLQQAREKRAGQVRQLKAELEAQRVENAELRLEIAELRGRLAEASELAQLRLRLRALQDLHTDMAKEVFSLYRSGVITRAQLPEGLASLADETGDNSFGGSDTSATCG